MKHLKIPLIFFIVISLLDLNAQSFNTWSFSSGQMSVADYNLSNQLYTGPSFAINANHEVFYKTTEQRVSWNIYDSWQIGELINVSNSAMIMYLGGHLGFGSHFHWRPIKGFTLRAGGMIDFYSAVKLQTRNVNNVVSADIQTNILANIAFQYKWQWQKWGLALKYDVSTPIMGIMFVPEMGQSYYEVITNITECIDDVTHLTSFHNRQGVRGDFSVNFILPHITLHCGFLHDNQWWNANHLHFLNHDLSAHIGFALRLETLSQIKNEL